MMSALFLLLLLVPAGYLLGRMNGRSRWTVLEQDALLFRTVVDEAVEAVIMVHDLADDARIVYANAAACRHFGVDRSTLAAWPRERWAPHDLFRSDGLVARPDGAPARFETEYMTAAGSLVPVEVTLTRLDFPGKRYLLSYARDMRSQRVMEERALRLEKRAVEISLERRYKEIFDNLLDGIVLSDVAPDGRLVIAGYNRRVAVDTGIPEIEAVGRTKEEVFGPELAARLTELDRRCLELGQPLHSLDVCDLPAGRRHVDNTLLPLRDQSGRVHRIVAISRDVTAIRQAEERNRLLGFALDHVRDAVYLVDCDGRFEYVNDAACRVLGCKRDVLLAMTVGDVDSAIPTEQWPRVWAVLAKTRRFRSETRHRRLDGSLIPVEVSSDYFEFEGRGYCLALVRDLTERRRLEQAEHKRMQEYRVLVEQSPDTIARFGPDARRFYANPKLVEISGKGASLVGTTPREFPGGAGGERYEAMIRQVLAGGGDSEFELEWMNGDGQPRLTLVRLVAERDPAGRVTGVIAIGRDITEHRQRALQDRARAGVFDLFASGADLPAILDQVVVFAELATPGAVGCIILAPLLAARYGRVIGPNLSESMKRLLAERLDFEGYAECCLDTSHGHPVFVPDLARQARCVECPAKHVAGGFESCWALPIDDMAGEWLGTFVFYWDRTGLPDVESRRQMEQARQVARLVIDRWRAEARIRHQAVHDPVTGLPNRAGLRDKLAAMMAEGEPIALFYIDLDNFKEVNDTLGHRLGDAMLREAARRLAECVPEAGLVARMSADEFIVATKTPQGDGHVWHMAEKLRIALAGDYSLDHSKVWGTASIGVALYPEHALDLDDFLGHADQAMYAAKAEGRDCWRLFSKAMAARSQDRIHMANDLRPALASGELAVHYQPIVDLANRRVVKAEALLRWTHPTRGPVSPALFIPIAEETGLIHEIGDWVFREAARVALAWNREAGDDMACRISVNRSPRQFFTGQGIDGWQDFMRSVNVPGDYLGVEITEGLLLDDRPEVIKQLRQLRAAGITVSLDDFGTGYSALSYLKKFDIDYLKIDRSFIRDIVDDPSDRAIVESIIAMAKRLGIKLIAEGVETGEQAQLLAAVGCDMAQGYFFARPMPEREFIDFVRAGPGPLRNWA